MGPYVMVSRSLDGKEVAEIVCHRDNHDIGEEYLVRWATSDLAQGASDTPFSWHSVTELDQCLPQLQKYLESLLRPPRKKKRKRDDIHEARGSPADRILSRDSSVSTSSASRLDSPASFSQLTSSTTNSARDAAGDHDARIYNGELAVRHGLTVAVPTTSSTVPRIDIRHVPTPSMIAAAKTASMAVASSRIHQEVLNRLSILPGPEVSIVNTVDSTSLPLNFEFIRENVLGKGVFAADPATRTGCTKCKAQMGQNMGCEYSKLCDCLEYAAVSDTIRMLPEERERWEEIKATGGGDTKGLPKKFPYFSSGPRARCLVPFYLDRRYPIYECNENCGCGPGCKTRVVQKGRQVRLEIMKTPNGRGWGLRSKDILRQGEFIDTYRGEIITDEEATRREKYARHGTKDSYLYSLDKFADTLGLEQEELYVIDGEFKGGPTRFMNHSCEPNCRQYVVSYNRHDPKVYEIAFFAIRDIAPNEELTFDYLDKDEDEDEVTDIPDPNKRNEDGMKPVKCLCGAQKCRKYLWM